MTATLIVLPVFAAILAAPVMASAPPDADPPAEAEPVVPDSPPAEEDAEAGEPDSDKPPDSPEDEPTDPEPGPETEETPAVGPAPTEPEPTVGTTETEEDPEVAGLPEPEVSTQGAEATPVTEPEAAAPQDAGKRKGLQRHRFVYSNLTALRYNPLGLVNEFTFGWRIQLIDKNTTLFKDSFISLNGHTYVSPAFGRVGPMVIIQPLAILNLSASYDGIGYFGTFDLVQSYPSPRADYSDTALEDGGEQELEQATRGRLITLSALLQAKAGRIAARDNVKFYYQDLDLRRDPATGREDTVSYDQTLDILMPDEGWTMTNDADLLYLFDFGLTLGARYTFTHAFYRDSDFLPGESTKDPNGPTHRVGPAVLYAPPKWAKKAAKRHNHSRKWFQKPTAILLVQWWAKHRFRTGEDVSAGVPYLVLAFRFQGDFFP